MKLFAGDFGKNEKRAVGGGGGNDGRERTENGVGEVKCTYGEDDGWCRGEVRGEMVELVI